MGKRPQAKPPASTEWGDPKSFFLACWFAGGGKKLFGPQKVFSPHSVLADPKPSIFIVLSFKFPRSCAQRQPPSKRMCSFAAAVLCKATLPQGVTNCKCAWQSACAVTSTNLGSPPLEELAKHTRKTFVSLSSHKTNMPSHALKYHRPWRMSA